MSSKGCEILIVGAGITGLTIARELLHRGVEDVLIIEKENKPGVHASGRNSGVLHAGVYYAPGTLKAKFCVQGNRLMKEFCRRKGLTLRENGKVIVVKDESELEGLFELKRRAEQSGARVQVVDSGELNDIEPYASTYEKALFSPDTAVVNPKEVVRAIAEELEGSGKVRILYGVAFSGLKGGHTALTQDTELAQKGGTVHFKKFINAAGAYADRVARPFGVGKGYRILPFKGTYKVLIKERSFLVRGNVYPVPDLRNPFLGVHFTRGSDDRVYIGPTAIPAFGRENYGGFDGLSLETISILYRDGILLFKDDGFRRNAASEIKKYSRRFFFEEAKRLLKGLKPEDLEDTDKVGIRPQLVDWGEKKLVMDFIVIKDGDSLHVLNAISPAFTSSMSFAGYIADLFLGDKAVQAMSS